MNEKILFGIAVFALAGIMVPITANATHSEIHQSRLLTPICNSSQTYCTIFIDKNDDGDCQESELSSPMKSEVVQRLFAAGLIAICVPAP